MTDKPVAVVTGGSSGIGQEIACEMSRRGYAVVICGRNTEGLESTSKLCRQNGAGPKDVLLISGDLSDPQQPDRIVSLTLQQFGRINALINNAGILKNPDSLEALTAESFDSIFSVNIRAPVLLTKACMPHLEKTKGTVINTSSAVTLKPVFGTLAYGMAKAAVNYLTETIACAYGPKGVRVCGILPGIISTPAIEAEMAQHPEAVRTMMQKGILDSQLLNRGGKVGDIAKAVAFLLSDDASFITGVNLPVDGGLRLSNLSQALIASQPSG